MRTLAAPFAATLALLALLACAPRARADLVDLGGSTLDTQTQLEWLDLTATVNVRPMDIMLREDSDQLLAAGWRFASFDEIAALFTHAGLTPPFDGTVASPRASALTLLALLGTTWNQDGMVGAMGYAPEGAARVKGWWYVSYILLPPQETDPAAAQVPGMSWGVGIDLFADPTIGSWMVRPVVPTGSQRRSWGSVKEQYRR